MRTTIPLVLAAFGALAVPAPAQPSTCQTVRYRTLDLAPGPESSPISALLTHRGRTLVVNNHTTLYSDGRPSVARVYEWDGLRSRLLATPDNFRESLNDNSIAVLDNTLLLTTGYSIAAMDLTDFSIRRFGPLAAYPARFWPIQTPQGPAVVFFGRTNAQSGLYIITGTDQSPRLLMPMAVASTSTSFVNAVSLGALVMFVPPVLAELSTWWRTDGTSEGTFRLNDSTFSLYSLRYGTRPVLLRGDENRGDRIYFGAMFPEPAMNPSSRHTLISSDGTVEGTTPTDVLLINDHDLGSGAGRVIVNHARPAGQSPAAILDPVSGSLRPLSALGPVALSDYARDTIDAGTHAFIETQSDSGGRRLWRYEPATESLTLAVDRFIGAERVIEIHPDHAFGPDGSVYLNVQLDTGGAVVRSTGSPQGTCIVARLDARSVYLAGRPFRFSRLNSRLFFFGTDAQHGLEPRVLDLCPPDFDNSGEVGVTDLYAFVTDYFSADPAADFDYDSRLSSKDIFDFLSAWFAGC
ncbi:MAG: GC-type dockerin domain-anchored protein [Phycisphaerales bacterium]